MKRFAIAVDGPAGSGKSTVAKMVARKLGIIYVDTGAMYRTVAVWAIENGIDFDTQRDKLISNLKDIKIDIVYDNEMQRMFLNGRDVSERIRENDASMGASAVATIAEVREFLVDMQRKMAKKGGVIVDGRDIGTVVLPNAELKIYLTASVVQRAQRRYKEYIEKGIECDFEAIKDDVIKRDYNDMNRDVSPLRQAENAVLVDTTDMSFDDSVECIKGLIKKTEEEN